MFKDENILSYFNEHYENNTITIEQVDESWVGKY